MRTLVGETTDSLPKGERGDRVRPNRVDCPGGGCCEGQTKTKEKKTRHEWGGQGIGQSNLEEGANMKTLGKGQYFP